jgi:hypothetical protein
MVMRWPTTAGIRSLAAACALCVLAALAWAGVARADERIYWANTGNNTIDWATVDGNGAGQVNTTGAPISSPVGIVLDPADGKIFWANSGGPAGDSIGWAYLNNSGGGTLNTAGTSVNDPSALTVDPATGTLYWINQNPSQTISGAYENGDGGGPIGVPNSTSVGDDTGMTFDPVSQRFYWADPQGGYLGYMTLGQAAPGAGFLHPVTGATLNYPFAIAYNIGDGGAYWTNDNGKIGTVRADNPPTGSGDVNTTGATTTYMGAPLNLTGIAIDEHHFRVYWAGSRQNGPSEISYAHLDVGGGGADVDTTGATVATPGGVALLDVPGAGLAPTITGKAVTGAPLTCTQGSWLPDDTAAFYWRAPSIYKATWTFNGGPLPGGFGIGNATGTIITPSKPGSYTCTLTGINAAGSDTSDPSQAVQVTTPKSGGGSGGGGGGGTGPSGPPALALGRIHQTHRRWAVHRYRARPHHPKPPPYGTTFTATVNRAASVSFSFAALRKGRLVHHRCVVPTAAHRHARHCVRTVAAGTLTRRPKAARTLTLRLRGELAHKTLTPGNYRLTVTAIAPGTPIASRRIRFTVVRSPRPS